MSHRHTVAPVVQARLQDVLAAVNAITDPGTGQRLQIPDFAAIHDAAGRLLPAEAGEGRRRALLRLSAR